MEGVGWDKVWGVGAVRGGRARRASGMTANLFTPPLPQLLCVLV